MVAPALALRRLTEEQPPRTHRRLRTRLTHPRVTHMCRPQPTIQATIRATLMSMLVRPLILTLTLITTELLAMEGPALAQRRSAP